MAFPENIVNDTGIKHIWDKVTAAISGKVDKVSGKGLSTNDYTTAEKDKLAGIESGAQVNAVTSVAGKIGAVTLDKADVGLGNVDNTSDANKPISTATQNALDDKADANDVKSTQTLTGNPITITDAAGINAEKLKVTFSPKQDLHGYDFPWVGGSGKNKFPLSVESVKEYNSNQQWSGNSLTVGNVTLTLLTDDSGNCVGIDFDGTANRFVRFVINAIPADFPDGNYLVNGVNGGSVGTYIGKFIRKENFDVPVYGGEDTAVVIDSTESHAGNFGQFRFEIQSGVTLDHVKIYPQIRLASVQDSTFAPWENICPITGYTEVGVEDVGVNQWDEETKQGYYNASTGAYVNVSGQLCTNDFIPVNPSTTYYCKKGFATNSGQILFYDAEKHYLSYLAIDSFANKTFQTPANCYYMTFNLGDAYGTTYNNDISINYPSTDHDYHAYQHSSATIPFSQTLYGGVSDFVEGGTESTHAVTTIAEMAAGSHITRETASGRVRYVITIAGMKKQTVRTMADLYSEQYVTISDGRSYSNCPDYCIFNRPEGGVFINDQRYESVSDFVAANGDIKICYPLETANTLSTQPSPLKLLQGTNNLTTNGTTITLDYIPNNSIGDAVKASEEYTDRAVERVAPKATLIDTWMISEESDTISVDLTSYDCNFFLLEYLFNSKRGTTLIPRPQGGSFSASVVTYNNGSALYIELTYNPTTKELAYTSNITSQFGILAIYTI